MASLAEARADFTAECEGAKEARAASEALKERAGRDVVRKYVSRRGSGIRSAVAVQPEPVPESTHGSMRNYEASEEVNRTAPVRGAAIVSSSLDDEVEGSAGSKTLRPSAGRKHRRTSAVSMRSGERGDARPARMGSEMGGFTSMLKEADLAQVKVEKARVNLDRDLFVQESEDREKDRKMRREEMKAHSAMELENLADDGDDERQTRLAYPPSLMIDFIFFASLLFPFPTGVWGSRRNILRIFVLDVISKRRRLALEVMRNRIRVKTIPTISQ
eukprot:Plantae.Rhodophyta-Palmaria_palmata.ctg2216.p1 GENE.Plantae.Rhodophyta-Palmaria_palmata.ctg2216~~Plantae.Rhodophyta-Palmaria_palmata.ctg2216.p1  ORF type:complete len:285 (+),score=44.14 Plantae.Rhodophyta-Palmaria_palmata.ctg2216:34-855(+)